MHYEDPISKQFDTLLSEDSSGNEKEQGLKSEYDNYSFSGGSIERFMKMIIFDFISEFIYFISFLYDQTWIKEICLIVWLAFTI